MIRLLRLLLILCATTGPAANAACSLHLENIARVDYAPASIDGYNVYDHAAYPQAIPLTVRHKKQPCRYFVTFGPGQSGGVDRRMHDGPDALHYQLYTSANQSNVLRDLPAASNSEIIAGEFGDGPAEMRHEFYLVIPPQQVVPPGIYRDTVTVTLYEGTPAHYIETGSRHLRIQAVVREQIDLSIADKGMAMDPARTSRVVDFGLLSGGETAMFDVLVRSNAGYRILLESGNRGAMKILDPRDASTVPYRLRIDGSHVDLAGRKPVTVSTSATRTAPAGVAHDMEITVGPPGDATAGDYRDTITITVISGP